MIKTNFSHCIRFLGTTGILAFSTCVWAQTSGIEEEIVVVGIFEDVDRVTGSAHRVNEDVLEAFRHDDINRVLNFVPGVYIREEDGFGLRPNIGLRGGSSDRSQKVTLMEDGVLFSPAAYSAPAAYFFPLTQRMVGVEVFKGPSSIEFGPQTIGGAINLVSAPIPETTQFEAGVAGGSDSYRSVQVRTGGQMGEFGVLAEFVHIASDGFKSLDGGGNTGFEKNEFSFKIDRDLGPGNLELRVGYADEVSDETYLGLTEDDFRDKPERRYGASALDRMDWDWYGGRATWTQDLWGGSLSATAYYHSFERAWRKFNNFNGADIRQVLQNPDSPFNQLFVRILQGNDTDQLGGTIDDIRIGTNDREFVSNGIQASLTWEFGDEIQHNLRVGARYHYDRVRRLHDEFGYEQLDGVLVLNNQGRAILTDNTGRTDALALWVRDEITFGSWTVVPGLRVEAIENEFRDRIAAREQDNDYTVVLPGIGASYEITDGFSLLAGAHRGFSPASPSLTDNLDEEDVINYELGARWLTDIGRFELIGYYSDYENLTSICTFSSGCNVAELGTQTNAGEVITEGIEASWTNAFSMSNGMSLPVALTYTYTSSEFEEAFTSSNPQFGEVLPGYELPYIPEHRANANIGLEGSNWGVQLSVTYVDRMRDQAGSGSFADDEGSDASTIVDLSARIALNQNWELSARVDNAGDSVDVASRRPFGARPIKPLAYRFEARYRL